MPTEPKVRGLAGPLNIFGLISKNCLDRVKLATPYNLAVGVSLIPTII